MPDLCILHPLSAWLWLILCLSPTVLYQLGRSLSACELAARLAVKLYDEKEEEPGEKTPQFGLPEGNFLMPDRASVPLSSIPPLQKYMQSGSELNAGHVIHSAESEVALDASLENMKSVR